MSVYVETFLSFFSVFRGLLAQNLKLACERIAGAQAARFVVDSCRRLD